MATTKTPGSVVLRCNLGWEDMREVMATSHILTLMRRAWTVAGFMFAALLDQAGPHVRGFIPKAGGDLPPDSGLGDMIRERILAGAP